MKPTFAARFTTTWLMLGGVLPAGAQCAPPPPPAPFAGFINEALREDDAAMSAWDLGGSARGRFEYRDGGAIAGTPGSLDFRDRGANVLNQYWLARLRYHAAYTDPWWGAYVQGQNSLAASDARFASTTPLARKGDGPEADVIELHQAFVTVGNHKEFPLSLKIGRQELIYGDERIIGALGWNNIGRTFDAAKVRWQNAWFSADFFTGRPVIPEDGLFDVSNDYEWFSGMYATSEKIPKHTLDFFVLARDASIQAATAEPYPQFPQPSARDILTVGARLKSVPGQLGGWDYLVDIMGQFGTFRDTRAGAPTERLDQQAWALVVQGGYTFADVWGTPRLGFEYAHGSGDSDPFDDDHGTFDNLYPTNHKFYGYADFVSLQNIHDLRTILQCRPGPRWSVALEGHLFWLANTGDNFYTVGGVPRGGVQTTPGTGYGVNPDYGGFVGSELDLVAGWAVTRYALVEAGYSHFFASDYIEQSLSDPAYGARDANWFYAQVTVNF